MLFHSLSQFAPFKIDALGLVTILGSRELDLLLGALRRTNAFEALPTFAPYLAAGGYLSEPIPGFHLYNITDAIVATDISAWFGRWLLAQTLTWNSTNIYISGNPGHRTTSRSLQNFYSLLLSSVCIGAALTTAVFTSDNWAIANAISMHLLGVLRWYLLGELRTSMQSYSGSPPHMNSAVKVLCTLPNGKAVTIYTTRSIVVDYLLTNPVPRNRRAYVVVQGLSWMCYVAHILALGMALLVNQIIAVGCLSANTLLVVAAVGVNNAEVGCLQLVTQDFNSKADSRSEAYQRMQLTQEEEEGLVAWGLAPQRRNAIWWEKYERMKAAKSP